MKNVLITGASSGIGYELSRVFSDKGWRVYAIARSEPKLKQLNKYSNNIISCVVDVTNSDELLKIYEQISAEVDAIDIIINNAGHLVNKPFLDTSQMDLQTSFDVNLFAPYNITKLFIPLLVKSKGHVVNIGSMGGIQGSSKYSGLSAYSASKGALSILTECLSEELKEFGISINCLALGAVQTEMLSRAFPGYKVPTSPIEIAAFIYDFATVGNKFMNGRIIPVALNNP